VAALQHLELVGRRKVGWTHSYSSQKCTIHWIVTESGQELCLGQKVENIPPKFFLEWDLNKARMLSYSPYRWTKTLKWSFENRTEAHWLVGDMTLGQLVGRGLNWMPNFFSLREFSHQKNEIMSFFRKMDGTGDYHVNWNKPDSEWQISHAFSHRRIYSF
jgi:hypothetical protein